MPVPTKPAFIHSGSWDEETRQHEAMAWMEKYTYAVDAKAWNSEPFSNWFTPDSVLQKSTGEVVTGGEAAWKSLREEVYAPFAAHYHDAQFLVTWETETGWEMFGVAALHWNLAVPGDGGAKVKDAKGNEWDGVGPAAFNFHYRKTGEGIRLSKTAIYADPTAAVVAMLKRGMLKPEDMMK